MTWRTSTLGEVVRNSGGLIQTGPFGSQLHQADYVAEGVPAIMPKDITVGEVDQRTVARVSESTADRLRRHQLASGAIVLPRRGDVSKRALIREEQSGWLCGTGCLQVVLSGHELLPEFLYYYMELPEASRWLEQNAVGSTMLNLSASIVKKFPVRFPSLTAQRRLSTLLRTFDDLIANNRRRMALLEDAARQLFREWFVRLRFPGHEHTRMSDGLPDGWIRKSLGEVADFQLGKMLDQNKNRGELLPYLANINVRWGRIDLDNLRDMRFEEDELERFGLKYGDIVICEGGEPGRCAIWREQLPNMMFQKALHRIRALPNVSSLFVYYSLRHQAHAGHLASLFTGSTIKHLPREKLALVRIDVPPKGLMDRFAEHVDPMEKQIGLLEAANRRATQARNLLLPRLMSGELTI